MAEKEDTQTQDIKLNRKVARTRFTKAATRVQDLCQRQAGKEALEVYVRNAEEANALQHSLTLDLIKLLADERNIQKELKESDDIQDRLSEIKIQVAQEIARQGREAAIPAPVNADDQARNQIQAPGVNESTGDSVQGPRL